MLATYATDDVMAKTEIEITNLKQLEFMSTERYSERLWEKTLRCGCFCENQVLNNSLSKDCTNQTGYS